MDATCSGVGFSQRQKGGALCCFYSCWAFFRPVFWMKLSKEKSNKQKRINSKSQLTVNNCKCLAYTIHSFRRGKKEGWNADQKGARNGKWDFRIRWQRERPLKSILCSDLLTFLSSESFLKNRAIDSSQTSLGEGGKLWAGLVMVSHDARMVEKCVFLLYLDSDSGVDTTWILTLSFLSPCLQVLALSYCLQLCGQSWGNVI